MVDYKETQNLFNGQNNSLTLCYAIMVDVCISHVLVILDALDKNEHKSIILLGPSNFILQLEVSCITLFTMKSE